MKKLYYIPLYIILNFSCSTPQQKIPEIVIKYNASETQINLNELATDLDIIRLETNDSALIPQGFNPCMGDHYLVLECFKTIYQFTREGKYIRQMLTSGKGPEEFISCASQLIDNQNELYFMIDRNKRLFIYDLNKGKLLQRKSLPFPMKLLKIVNDTIICYPDLVTQKYTIPYTLCALNFEGNIIQTLKDTITDPVGSPISIGFSEENKILLKTQKSDTVYIVENWKKIPAYTLHGKYFQDPEAAIEFSLLKENSTDYYFNLCPISYKFNQEGKMISMSAALNKFFRVNKQTLKPEAITHIYVDTLNYNFPYYTFRMNENAIYLPLSPIIFHKILREKAEKKQLSPALQKIYDEISEDDNPLIFIAKNK